MKLLRHTAAALSVAALTVGSAMAQAPANDDCSGAISIASSFGGAVNTVMTSGPYDNTNATAGATDPTTGWECFGEPTGSGTAPEINNSMWYTFVGDGEKYFIETGTSCAGVTNPIDAGDTQITIYSGTTCGSLTPVACNEDGPSATSTVYPAGLTLQTVAGTTYYMMVDGFNFTSGGTSDLSNGQYCILVKKLLTVNCTDPAVSAGTTTAANTFVCAGQTVGITATGLNAPNVGSAFGIGWVVSNADISGSTDPLANPAVLLTYVVQAPTASSSLTFNNNGANIGGSLPYGTYYWTPVVFGNATQTTPGTAFLHTHTLDPNCTFVGNSVAIQVEAPNPTSGPCFVQAAPGAVNAAFAINSVYPVPVVNTLNLEVSSAYASALTVSVKDVLGREVASKVFNANAGSVNNYEISMETQTAGVYFVTVSNGRETAVTKFIKE